MISPLPSNEPERLEALWRYGVLDTAPEEAFDELVQLAARICGTPIALISLVDASRQWFKARVGLEAQETPRDASFCAHALHDTKLFIVHDARADPRFASNPLVVGEPNIRFYAGAPIASPEGLNLGTLCVIDRQPRVLDVEQREALRVLSRQVVGQFELRRLLSERAKAAGELDRLKTSFITSVTHDLRTPLTSIRGSLGLLASGAVGELTPDARQLVDIAERNSLRLMALIDEILDFEQGSSRLN
jgi:GAF domain-containing protein